jgi:hypothetical protein
VSPRGRLGTGNQQPIGSDDNWCDQQVGRLASLDFEDRFRQLLRLARQSNVSFYPVDVGGLRVSVNSGARNTLLELAENTDGIAVTNTNDLTGAVRRLTDSMAAYYLLGYYSTNAAADGRYREIRVRVKQPGATVSARPGYFAPTPAALAAAKAPPPPPPSPVDDELGRLARARPDAELHAYGIHAGDHLDVVVELASRLVSGPWKAGADIRATLRGTSGTPVVTSGRIEPGMRSARLALPLDQSQPGPWTIDLRLSADAGVLDAAASIAAPAGPLFNDAMLFRASPSLRSIPKVTADPQFRRIERLHVEWRPLKALTARSARLLDRQGQALPMEPVLSERDEGGVRILVLDLNLAPLGEGSYVVELTGTSGSETERDLVAFKIVR